MGQAEEYVDSLYKGNKLNCKPKIKAFVVGDTISEAISTKKTQEDYGEVLPIHIGNLLKPPERDCLT